MKGRNQFGPWYIEPFDNIDCKSYLKKKKIAIEGRIEDLKAEIYEYEKVLKLIKNYNH